uniref:Uncharacterized protein n=1 Tax=Trypanosoma congolense (strain IL3000) TaxID=1068625 RepID=G0UM08_TRYCI|nr:hypothetical protein, unlikely [Trypanosoma congolense IL3000]
MCSSHRHQSVRLIRRRGKLRLMSILWPCSEGISEERLQLGRQLCNQLRVIQTVKGRHGVGIEALREAIEYPHKKRRHVFIQAALKAKRHQTAVPLNRARCVPCVRMGHYSASCRAFEKKPDNYGEKNGFRPLKQ